MVFSDWISEHYEEKGPAKWLAFSLECVAAAVLMALMLLTCADVIGRYFLNNAVDGTVEITELALAVVVFAEMPVITWRGGHVVVDLLDRYMNHRLVKALGLLSALLVSGAFYAVAGRMMFTAERSLRREVVTEYLQMPVGYIVQYISVMSYVCAVVMVSYGIYRILNEER
ncbi:MULTISPECIES: TRAP transporter small permease [Oceanospirillaceae]|uniref:TRAP transporter small permease protein n=1 Tax=Oceanobacter antarcticus TaxID=3133425 RepID=A0ABW8NF69_9GAMM|tara:strand:- start:20867 stop:21379 length:513 start_codon:yes stop_codon:yes gene_type:complete